ncbi:pilus assembly FimT family protein [Sedimentisphaera salicampi]|uniref:pilus assembly FimT family protein n=1 Tax=Sedimentisphaera salicampi TaxID=1941349 RepID=UPI000B9A34F5|nr:type II secretion system protein [Sedimentisphaera salicampi]
MKGSPKNILGFSLVEMMMCLVVVGLITGIVIYASNTLSTSARFQRQAYHILETFREASIAASQSDRRYGVMFDFINFEYVLYEINTDQPYSKGFETLREEDILESRSFNDYCELLYVQFDDGEYIDSTSEQGKALFLVGKGGWDYGGKVVLADIEGNLHSIVVNRLGNNPELLEGDVQLLEPAYDLSF